MYPSYLGKFNIPASDPDWVSQMTYTAEPPVTVRHSMNPWETERQREVWLAEEAAWKKIVPLQAEYRALSFRLASAIREIQHWLRDLETLTGKKSGLADAANYGTLVYSLAGGPYAWAAALAKFGLDMILGIGKKKQAKSIMDKLTKLAAQVAAIQATQQALETTITTYIHEAEGIRAAQPVKITADLQASETAYQQKRTLDATRAAVLRERNRQVALMPRSYGGSDVL